MLGFLESKKMKLFLYKGGLHKVTGVPRKWSSPSPAIKLSVFRRALQLRSDALRLRKERSCTFSSSEETHSEEGKVSLFLEDDVTSRKRKRALDEEEDDEQIVHPPPVNQENQQPQEEQQQHQEQPSSDQDVEQAQEQRPPQEQAQEVEVESHEDKARRRSELQETLSKLTTEKHRYVLILKQILSNEEESKKRAHGSLQSPAAAGAPSTAFLKAETSPTVPPPSCPDFDMRPLDLEEGELECTRTPSPLPSGSRSLTQAPSRLASSLPGQRSGRVVKWDSCEP